MRRTSRQLPVSLGRTRLPQTRAMSETARHREASKTPSSAADVRRRRLV